MKQIPTLPVCDTTTAMRILGVSRQTVLRMLRDGELKGYRCRGKHLVYLSSVDKVMGVPPERARSYLSSAL